MDASQEVRTGVPPRRYTRVVASLHPRIQVTVDPELAEALSMVDPSPASKSRLVRDLALLGAKAVADEQRAADEATALLLAIADGSDDRFDLDTAALAHAERDVRLP